MPLAATARRRAPRAFGSTEFASASTWPAECSPRLAAAWRRVESPPSPGAQGYGERIIFNAFAAAVIGAAPWRRARQHARRRLRVVLLGLVQNILDLGNVSNYWIEVINGSVILFALLMARVIGGEVTAE